MSAKPLNDPFEGSSLLKKSVAVLVILTFISTFFGLDRSLSSLSTTYTDPDYRYDWRIVCIVYYLCVAINALLGFAGLIYDKTSLLIPFAFFLFVLFIFGLTTETLRRSVFGAVIEPFTELITIAYIFSLRATASVRKTDQTLNVWTVSENNMREDVL